MHRCGTILLAGDCIKCVFLWFFVLFVLCVVEGFRASKPNCLCGGCLRPLRDPLVRASSGEARFAGTVIWRTVQAVKGEMQAAGGGVWGRERTIKLPHKWLYCCTGVFRPGFSPLCECPLAASRCRGAMDISFAILLYSTTRNTRGIAEATIVDYMDSPLLSSKKVLLYPSQQVAIPAIPTWKYPLLSSTGWQTGEIQDNTHVVF